MINCMIIDDEPLSVDVLSSYIQKLPFLNLKASFNSSLQALEYAGMSEIDLIFLDIHIPDLNGLNFYKTLSIKPEVIFTTAYSEYATTGFELNAIDYLLKPIPLERFVSAVNKAKDYIAYKNSRNVADKDYFFISAAYKTHKVLFDDILWLEGLKDYTKVFLKGTPNPLLILHNLKYFEDFLPKKEFIRVHRSYIVSVRKMDTITRKQITIGNSTIPVSDNYRDRIFSVIGDNQ